MCAKFPRFTAAFPSVISFSQMAEKTIEQKHKNPKTQRQGAKCMIFDTRGKKKDNTWLWEGERLEWGIGFGV
jgi:hypothetical protein